MLKFCRICMLVLFLINGAWATPVFNVQQSNTQEIVVNLSSPAFKVNAYSLNQQIGQHIDIKGFSQTSIPGHPQLPVAAHSIVIPFDAQPTLHILEQKSSTHRVDQIVSTPFWERDFSKISDPIQDDARHYVYKNDEKIYNNDSPYPQNIIELGEPFVLRGQKVLPIRFYPVQYLPLRNEIVFYEDVKIKIRFNGSAPNLQKNQVENGIFQDMLSDMVLNPECVNQWPEKKLYKRTNSYFLDDGEEWFKIYFQKKGIYVITYSDLMDAGMDVDQVNPENLQMYWMGQPLAIYIHGQEDGSFDENDYIEFYGFNFKNFYTHTPVFWLTEAKTPGKRMAMQDATPIDGAEIVNSGRQLLHVEKDSVHYAVYPGHTNEDSWYMGYHMSPSEANYIIKLNSINYSDTLSIFRLNGRGMTDVSLSPDHHTIISINDNDILDSFWDGFELFTPTATFHSQILVNGENVININQPGDTGAAIDWFFPDFFQIVYNRYFVAMQDTLEIKVDGDGDTCNVLVTNFENFERCVYNVTDSLNVIRVENFETLHDSLYFSNTLYNEQTYALTSLASRKTPISITKDEPSFLKSNNHQIDYIIISHSDFIDIIQPLADFHKSTGKAVFKIDLTNIYDEFNYGVASEFAIKDFLEYAYKNWPLPAPTFVLLVGDGSYDPRLVGKGFYGTEKSDYIPTHLFEASADYFEAASDNWFAAVDGDDIIPDLLVGRICARNPEEVTNTIIKILSNSTIPLEGDWYNHISYVCDDGEGGVLAFEDSINTLITDIVPESINVEKIYIAELGKTETKNRIYDAFDDGRLLINFLGHGSATTWMGEQVMASPFVQELRGGTNLPFVVTMSCNNGFFIYPMPNFPGLAEAMAQAKQRGAVGVFSGSGKAYAPPMYSLGRGLYSALFQDVDRIAGSFTTRGLVHMYLHHPSLEDHLMFHILFGDPALQLHYQPSWQYVSSQYFGSLEINQSPVPEQSVLVAIINDSLEFKSTITNKGEFSLTIPADNPNTDAIDGGSEGDTLAFKVILPDSVYYLLDQIATWQAHSKQELNLTATGTNIMSAAEYEFFINSKKVGESIVDGDVIPRDSRILIHAISKEQNALYKIYLNEIPLEAVQKSVQYSSEGYVTEFEISTMDLNDGTYHLKIKVDNDTRKGYAEEEISFQLYSKLAIADLMNWPNPMNTETHFSFILENDKAASGKIIVFSLAGRKITELDLPLIDVGFNQIYWDGRDQAGDLLANGVYLYKVVIREENESIEQIEKIMVMR